MADGTSINPAEVPAEPAMRRRILDAAADLLAENGYQATTLRGIADAAGLKAASIYYHFPSKEQITVEVLNEGVEYVSRAVAEATADLAKASDARKILAAAIRAHLAALSEHQSYTRASIRCFSTVPEEIRQQTVECRRQFDQVWLDALRQIQGAGALSSETDLKSLHLIILGALNWTIEWRAAGEIEKQALAGTLVDLVFQSGR